MDFFNAHLCEYVQKMIHNIFTLHSPSIISYIDYNILLKWAKKQLKAINFYVSNFVDWTNVFQKHVIPLLYCY